MQLSDIRTRVRYYLREATANVWADAELTALINLAQRYIATRLNPVLLPQLVRMTSWSITAGTGHSDLPATFLKVAADPYTSLGLVYTFHPVSMVPEFIAQHESDDTYFGTRRISWLENQDLYYLPDATMTLILKYIKYPADLSADGNISEIEDGFIDLVIIKAAADALVKTRQMTESAELLKHLEFRISQANGEKRK